MGLANVVKGNLGVFMSLFERDRSSIGVGKGPRGTLKMLVDGAGQIKMTKVGLP
jgi:hypothetical protein